MIERVSRTVNGKLLGTFYHFDDGSVMYLAHYAGKKNKHFISEKNSWYFDIGTVTEAQHRGVTIIGIAHRVGKNMNHYITYMEDFAKDSVPYWGKKETGRSIELGRFKVNTALNAERIEKSMKINK